MDISHVLNAAHGKIFCKGSHEFYGDTIEYYGVPAYDLPDFDISPYFYPAAEFIHKALTTPGGTKSLLIKEINIMLCPIPVPSPTSITGIVPVKVALRLLQSILC